MLKITIEHGPEEAIMRLEGRVAGPWVDEFRRAWHSLLERLGSRRLYVDLRGVTHMSTDGRRVLADIHNRTGAELLTDSPLTQYFADEARRRQ